MAHQVGNCKHCGLAVIVGDLGDTTTPHFQCRCPYTKHIEMLADKLRELGENPPPLNMEFHITEFRKGTYGD